MLEEVVAPAGTAPTPADRPAWPQRHRLLIAVVALIVWLLLTSWTPPGVTAPRRSGGLVEAVTDTPQWGILLAALMLAGVAALCRWGDLGLNLPRPASSLRLLWLPAIYLLIFAAADLGVVALVGPLPAGATAILLLNVVLAGCSEELMFRGVLLGALRQRLPTVPAVVIAALLFGSAHLLNAALLGSLKLAATQAVAAAMSGVVFTAIRLRTGSLLAAMAYHVLWDFLALMAVARPLSESGSSGGAAALAAGADDLTPLMLATPILLLLPNFLYAVFLLRKVGQPPAG